MRLSSLIPVVALAGLALPALASAQIAMPIDCDTNGQWYEGTPGTTYIATCPAGCGTNTAWGTGTYSDDSSICTAAIHAGVLTQAGGDVFVTLAPGLSAYPASTQNGITTSAWGSWGASFTVAPVPAYPIVTCDANAQTLEGEVGTTIIVQCPGCPPAPIWGTGIYSDDSSICTAAAHAGFMELGAGGLVAVTIQPGQQQYTPSSQFGITSSAWGQWVRSFSVANPLGSPEE